MSVSTNAGDEGPFYRGTQLVIICSVSVDDAVNTSFYVDISWSSEPSNGTICETRRSGQKFNRTVTIDLLDTSDSAVYTCTARIFPNDTEGVIASNDTTATINITVKGTYILVAAPLSNFISHSPAELREPIVTPADTISLAGKPFSIDCNFSAPLNLVEPPTVEWLNSSLNVVFNNKTLSFSKLKTSHGGRYICRVNISIPALGISLSGNETTAITVNSKS